jgi:regulator of sigma E protease
VGEAVLLIAIAFLPSGVVTLLAFLFVLGVLIFVHELGHFLVARLHGVRVLRFSLGFDPRIVKFTRGGTEYSIGVIPLGGFVKLAGETVDDARTGAPDEFMSQSKWVRFQVYLAGPVMNLLLAWIVLAGVLSRGADVPLYHTAPAVLGRIEPGSPAERFGLQVGDRVMSVNGVETATWDAFDLAVATKADRSLRLGVIRQGQPLELQVTPQAVGEYDMGDLGVAPVLRPQILQVTADSPAERAGLKAGDVVLAVNGARGLDQPAVIDRFKNNPGKPLELRIERLGEEKTVTVVPTDAGMVGISIYGAEMRRIDPTLWQAFGLSARQNWEATVAIGGTIRDLITREAPMRQLMGPLAIAGMSGTAAQLGWLSLLQLMAMLSLNLALLNLMPVPVLDGGHIAILAAEGLARRDFSVRIKERVLMAGAALIVLLMVTVIYNDVMRLLR